MRKNRFFNLDSSIQDTKSLFDILKWKLSSHPEPWPKKVENACIPQLPVNIENDQVFITFINHSTVLIQLQKWTILTDPVFSEIVGPYSLLGPQRVCPPGLSIEQLPKIDFVIISHNHYDHMDLRSLSRLKEKDNPSFILPLGNRSFLRGIESSIELNWWEQYIQEELRITLTPAQHWSRRGLLDHCKALWGGFVIQSSSLKIFFAGDTGYNSHFRMIHEKFGPMDVSLLPIGAYEPRWFMKEFHMNPEDAVQAHLDLASTMSLGIHHGTFRLTDEAIDDPRKHLQQSLELLNVDPKTFIALQNGQTVSFKIKKKGACS